MNLEELQYLSSEDFKERLLELVHYSEEREKEVRHCSVWYINVMLGSVPYRMTQETFLDIVRIGEFKFNVCIGMPLLPVVQRSWSGSQVADWLISAESADESKRSSLSSDLNGCRFLQGNLLEYLTKEEIDQLDAKLRSKIAVFSSCIWSWSRTSHPLCAATRSCFGRDLRNVSSEDELKSINMKRCSQVFRALQLNESISPEAGVKMAVERAFGVEYLGKELIAKSFIEHIKNLRGKSREYFACYTSLGQSSGMGKTRMLCEDWEDEECALFIVRISCAQSEVPEKTILPTGRLVQFIMGLRTQEHMSRLLWSLLYLVLEQSTRKNGHLKDPERLSLSLEDLELTFEDVINIYQKPESFMIEYGGFKAIKEKIEKMKLYKRGLKVKKSVIPVIAFDEADILSNNTFELDSADGTPESETSSEEVFDTLRLITQSLNAHKDNLDNCPFILVGENAMSANFGPSSVREADYSAEQKKADPVTRASKLFDPFILTQTFGIFADSKYRSIRSIEIGNWTSHIMSPRYRKHLCKQCRPLALCCRRENH
jgi:hypothetical protein